MTTQDVPEFVQELFALPDGSKAVTVTLRTAEPPFEAVGTAVHETVDFPSSFDVADTFVGGLGTSDGTTTAEAPEETELPEAFVAMTVK